jgi:hypothetical protein
MAFTVPTTEPPQPLGLNAGEWIEASSMKSLVLRDRFLFATRRRLIASLGQFTTNSSSLYQAAYAFEAKTLPTANDTLIIGFQATNACTVRVIVGLSTFVALSVAGPGSIIGVLSGVPIGTWFRVFVEVKGNTGSPVTVRGIYIAEQVLDAADLP